MHFKMKRLLTIAMLHLICVTINAQNIETLIRREIPADEMLGRDASVEWSSEHVLFSQMSTGKSKFWTITIGNAKSIFSKGAGQLRVGYYNDKDSLIWNIKGFMGFPSENMQSVTFTYGFPKDSIEFSKGTYIGKGANRHIAYILDTRGIMNYMERGGYIRIVTPLYDGSLYDVRVRMPKKDEKEFEISSE